MNALPSPEHNTEAVLAAIHSSAGTLCTRVGYWRRRPPGYLAVFSTFARLRPGCLTKRSGISPHYKRARGTQRAAPTLAPGRRSLKPSMPIETVTSTASGNHDVWL